MSIHHAAYTVARTGQDRDPDLSKRWQRFSHTQIKARNLQPIMDRLNEVYAKNQRAMDRVRK